MRRSTSTIDPINPIISLEQFLLIATKITKSKAAKIVENLGSNRSYIMQRLDRNRVGLITSKIKWCDDRDNPSYDRHQFFVFKSMGKKLL